MQQDKTFNDMTAETKLLILEYAEYEKQGVRHDKEHESYWHYQELVRDLIFKHSWDGIITDEVKAILEG